MDRNGRRVSVRGRLAALEQIMVTCWSCAAQQTLRVEMICDETGTEIVCRFGDDRAYCDECGRRIRGG